MKALLISARIWTRWILLALTIVFLITGLGITQYQLIEKATGGVLTKAVSFQIHNSIYLLIAFLVFLILHIFLAIYIARKRN